MHVLEPFEVEVFVVVTWQYPGKEEGQESVWAFRTQEAAQAKYQEIAVLVPELQQEGITALVRDDQVKLGP